MGAVVAPLLVLPACQVGAVVWRSARVVHRMFTWPQRLTILGCLLTAALNLVGHL